MLNIQNQGLPLCKINGGKYNNKIVYLDSDIKEDKKDDDLIQNYNNIKIPMDSTFQLLPRDDGEREILYITGASGSGKSFFTKQYCKEYKKLYPDRPIYLFSLLKSDTSLDDIKPKRVKLDIDLYDNPIPIEEFSESLVIFDDIDVISDKKIREAVYNILNNILEIGRHNKISCINTNHLATNGKDTKRILNESFYIVYFPHGSAHGIKYLLNNYLGIGKKDIEKAKASKSRWCVVRKNYPQIMITEHNIWIVD